MGAGRATHGVDAAAAPGHRARRGGPARRPESAAGRDEQRSGHGSECRFCRTALHTAGTRGWSSGLRGRSTWPLRALRCDTPEKAYLGDARHQRVSLEIPAQAEFCLKCVSSGVVACSRGSRASMDTTRTRMFPNCSPARRRSGLGRGLCERGGTKSPTSRGSASTRPGSCAVSRANSLGASGGYSAPVIKAEEQGIAQWPPS
jgi:hypothetical protein